MINCIFGPELISDLMCQPGALRRQLIGHARPFAQLNDLRIDRIQSLQTIWIDPDGIGEHTRIPAIVGASENGSHKQSNGLGLMPIPGSRALWSRSRPDYGEPQWHKLSRGANRNTPQARPLPGVQDTGSSWSPLWR